ncbi:MAG TPA: hypothetical protein DD473_21275 [Planctomycetaceae bacterium]|nr:hypothetical protein [Planctomycetaceae bacterium]
MLVSWLGSAYTQDAFQTGEIVFNRLKTSFSSGFLKKIAFCVSLQRRIPPEECDGILRKMDFQQDYWNVPF